MKRWFWGMLALVATAIVGVMMSIAALLLGVAGTFPKQLLRSARIRGPTSMLSLIAAGLTGFLAIAATTSLYSTESRRRCRGPDFDSHIQAMTPETTTVGGKLLRLRTALGRVAKLPRVFGGASSGFG